jgi:hypothetical protein
MEIIVMNKRLSVLPLVAITLALSIATVPAFAGKSVNAEKMTCEQFLQLDQEEQSYVVAYLHGSSGQMTVFNVNEYHRPVAYVVTECYKEKKATVSEKLKYFFKHPTKPMGKEVDNREQ